MTYLQLEKHEFVRKPLRHPASTIENGLLDFREENSRLAAARTERRLLPNRRFL